jgi:uncharacterized protein (DUF1684 family)
MKMTNLREFRKMKDDYFAHDGNSPLTPEQKKKFKGLRYFPPNPTLDLVVTVEEFPDKQRIEMQTTTGDIQTYERYGKFSFTVDGDTAELTIYHSADGYFLPFVDSLARKDTYPAGRYLEPEPMGKNQFRIDFNLAYNPYCAYNEYWSCPLTPFENRLNVPIRAGEKLFHS